MYLAAGATYCHIGDPGSTPMGNHRYMTPAGMTDKASGPKTVQC